MLNDLIAKKYLTCIPTPLGELIILGSRGRSILGLSLFYKSPPEAAATHVIRRQVKVELEAIGWTYQSRPSRNLMHFTTEQGQSVYVLARYGDYTVRSIRRILNNLRSQLIYENSVLLVCTRYPHRLKRLAQNSHGLLTLHQLNSR